MASASDESQPPENAVYTDEFARLMGVRAATIKHYTSQARKDWPAGRARPGFPLPKGKVLVDVPSPGTPSQPHRRVWVPWWDRVEVETFIAENPVAPGRRSRADQQDE